jgi:hypothetical protein
VPTFGANRLLSVSTLALDGYKLVFKNNTAIYTKDNVQYFKSTLLNSIYIVGEEQTRNARSAFIDTDDTDDVLDKSATAKSATINLTESIAELWHRRLAHTNNNDIQKLQKAFREMGQFAPKAKTAGDRACEECLADKIKESFNKKTNSRTTQHIRKVHVNISGIRTTTFQGYKYYLLVTDDTTQCSWAKLLKSKATEKVFPALIEIIALIKRETGDKVIIIRADNDRGEFRPEFQRRYKEKGMQFKPCPPYKHSMNRVSKQAIYTVDYKIRSLLFDAGLSVEFWCLALEHAI